MSTFVINSLYLRYSKKIFLQYLFYSSQPEYAIKKKTGKVVNVAIIGAPNSGKSTLINKIVERKICAASNKVHTTTNLIRAMCYQNETQIVFLDTPGVVTEKEKNKYKLPDSMIGAYHKSLRCANVIGVVHDISDKYKKDNLHSDVVNMLESVKHIPSFLIINKVDKIKTKKTLLTAIRNLTNGYISGNLMPGTEKKKLDKGYSHFSDVFLVSAINGDGVSDIKEYLMSNAKPANFQYDPSKWTDQLPEILIVQAVRAKFMDFLAQELPYNLKTELEYFEDNEEKAICSVIVQCPTERIVRLISGAGGGRLQQIKSHVRQDLIELFKKDVFIDLNLTVRVKEDDR